MRSISPQAYARAFLAATDSQADKARIVENFVSEIRRNGHWPRRRQILAECENAWRAKHGKSLLLVESARPLNSAQKEELEKAFARKHYDIEERLEPGLVAGVRLTLDGQRQTDYSLAHLLHKVFA